MPTLNRNSLFSLEIGPRLSDDTRLLSNQGLLDVLFEYSIQSDRSSFSIRPRFGRLGLRTVTVLRFLPPYIVTEKEVDRAIRILRKALAKAK